MYGLGEIKGEIIIIFMPKVLHSQGTWKLAKCSVCVRNGYDGDYYYYLLLLKTNMSLISDWVKNNHVYKHIYTRETVSR